MFGPDQEVRRFSQQNVSRRRRLAHHRLRPPPRTQRMLPRRNLRDPGRRDPPLGRPRSGASRLPSGHCATHAGPVRRARRLHLQPRVRAPRLVHPPAKPERRQIRCRCFRVVALGSQRRRRSRQPQSPPRSRTSAVERRLFPAASGGLSPPPNPCQGRAARLLVNTRTTRAKKRPMRLDDYAPRPAHIKWLLDSDPAIRWQVMRDLTGAAPHTMAAERSRVATEGWGAQLLARQSSAGDWPGGQWDLVTLWSLVVLKDLGLDPASKEARTMIGRVEKGLVYKPLKNRPFLHGETEPCINGRILGIGAYFKEPNDALADQLLEEQLEDGGWNCEAPKSRRSSFHTTICVLEGLLAYERARRKTGSKAAAITKA